MTNEIIVDYVNHIQCGKAQVHHDVTNKEVTVYLDNGLIRVLTPYGYIRFMTRGGSKWITNKEIY